MANKQPAKFGLQSKNLPYTLIEDRVPFGTKGALTKPKYVPPDIEIAWAAAPRIDDGQDIAERQLEGFDFVPLDKVTDDIDEAISEGKICLHTLSGFGEVDGLAGLQNFGLVLMFRPKDFGERHKKVLLDTWNARVTNQVKKYDGKLKRRRSKAKDIEKALDD